MTETARLVITVDASGSHRASSDLDRVARSGRTAERATDGLTRGFTRLAAQVAGIVSVTAALNKLVSTARSFQTLQAAIETATGSAENAARAFAAIQDFARETPYGLEQSAQAFVKLVNMGLEPSERAMRAYGNTASAMGKNLNDMIEAVADAATAEFERLKEFGIRAKNEGDTIAFTFQGVTTRVGNNAREIEEYLIRLGEVQFAGGMERRMQTLDGAIANLGDSWDQLFNTINEQGVGTVIEDSIRDATDAIDDLIAAIEAGQAQAVFDAWISRFDGFAQDFSETADFVARYWNLALEGMGTSSSEVVSVIVDAFRNLPENLRAIIQLMAVEVATLVDYGEAYGTAFAEVLGVKFASLVDMAAVYGRAIGNALNPFSDDSFNLDGELARIDQTVAAMVDDIFAKADQSAAIAREARRGSIEVILEEREQALDSFDRQIEAAQKLREEYEKNKAARTDDGDRLAGFRVGGGDGESGATASTASRDFEKLVAALQTEEEALRASYQRRNEIIQEEYDRRGQLILENEELTEQQKTERLAELAIERNEYLAEIEEDYQERLTAIEREGWTAREKFAAMTTRRQAATVLGELESLTAGVAQHNRAMFEANKIAATANAVISTHAGVAKSLETYPWPLAGVMAAMHMAAGMARVSAIQSTTFGSGGAAPSLSGATPAPPVTPIQQQPQAQAPQQRVYLEFTGNDTQQVSLRELRQQIRRIKEENPDAEVIF